MVWHWTLYPSGHVIQRLNHFIPFTLTVTICYSYLCKPLPLPPSSPCPLSPPVLLSPSPAPFPSYSLLPPHSLPSPATLHLSLFLFCRLIFSLQLAKDAEHVNKNIKKQCWNVWYEAFLLSSDESSSGASTGMSATPALSSGARRSSSNFENAPMASAVLNSAAMRKSRKVYCYISKKVCVF